MATSIATRRKFIFLCTIGFLMIAGMKLQFSEEKFGTFLPKSDAKEVWEFVSDMSSLKGLNPSVYDFHIVSESGNYAHWEYTAVIKETMSHIPVLTNINYADFVVRPEVGKYMVASKYRTCFFMEYFCLRSRSRMYFISENFGTKVEETIDYECPMGLQFLCDWELNSQRTAYMDRLTRHFS